MQQSHKLAIIVIITLLLSGNVLGLSEENRDIKHVFLHSWLHIGSLPLSLSPFSSSFLRSLSSVSLYSQVPSNVVMKATINVHIQYAKSIQKLYWITFNLKEL